MSLIKVRRIAQDSEIVALWQVLGDAKAYLREGKKNHNVKNLLAAAIKAAEKEDPNDRSVAEAKKVLAQFVAADACEDSAAKFRLGQEVIVKTKYADPYRARIVGLWDMSQNGPYGEQGYLVKNIKGGGVESMPEHALSLATAKDSAPFKPNDLVEWNDYKGRHNSAFYVRDNGNRITVSIEKNGQGGGLEIPKAWITNSRAADACGTDAKLQKGDKVRVWQQPVYGKMGEIVEATYGGMEYTVNVEGKDYPRIDYRRIVKVANAKDAAELNNDADLRAALSKMADIAKRLTGANVSFKAGWTPEGVGEISLEFPDSESARRYNYYKLFNAWEAARGQIIPRWAVNIGGYRVPRIEGNRMTIGILHFTT